MTSPRPPTSGAAPEQRADGAPDSHYDARYFDAELHRDHWFTNNAAKRARRWSEVLRMLTPAPDDRVLEIGCAAGEHALRLAREVREVVGIDLAPAAIERARLRAEREGIGNARFEIRDAADLSPWADASFDKVAAIDFVEHVDDGSLATILREVRRVLIPGGRLAIYTPCATHYVERLKARNLVLRQIPGHIAVRAPEHLLQLVAASGLTVEANWFLPSDYPGFGVVDHVLARLPIVGPWFRFRICAVAIKPRD